MLSSVLTLPLHTLLSPPRCVRAVNGAYSKYLEPMWGVYDVPMFNANSKANGVGVPSRALLMLGTVRDACGLLVLFASLAWLAADDAHDSVSVVFVVLFMILSLVQQAAVVAKWGPRPRNAPTISWAFVPVLQPFVPCAGVLTFSEWVTVFNRSAHPSYRLIIYYTATSITVLTQEVAVATVLVLLSTAGHALLTLLQFGRPACLYATSMPTPRVESRSVGPQSTTVPPGAAAPHQPPARAQLEAGAGALASSAPAPAAPAAPAEAASTLPSGASPVVL